MRKDIRWKQRFYNFEKAYLFLKKATELPALDELQAAGLIQSFEFTFELSWKTLKDYLEEMGISLKFPREVIKQAFQSDLIENGELWLEMLEKRNELTHTYNEAQTKKAVAKIRKQYFPALHQVYETLKNVSE
jgi:nucleotidyltransferase substrate binding protein (TIGR01987 family)